jgi:hypothetical protein
MSLRARVCAFVLVAAAPAAHARGTGEDAARHGAVPTLQAVRTAEPIRIDGRLDDAGWREAVPASEFRQLDPDEGQPATEKTELRIAYDDEAIYVGFRLFDSEPARIVRRLSRRDDSSDADYVRLYLDPRLDHQTGAQFQLTAAGVQSDSILFNDSWDDGSWDAVWESAVSLDEQGWSAELKIPFSQLRFAKGDAQTWGINAARFIQRKNETDWLELVPKKESGIASRMAHVSGLDGLKPRRAFSLLPYVVARSEHVEPGDGDPFNDGSRQLGGFGADLKYGITTNLTLDATVNPDFGQVEVDPAVVNLTEFETFFDERRPFFIEGAQIFSNFGRNGSNNFWGFNRSEPNLFYSRRIGRSPQGDSDADFADRPSATTIIGAAKVTGKTANGWSLGLLEAVTGREQARTAAGLTRNEVEVEPATNYLAARAHRDLGRAGVGLLATAVLRGDGTPALREQLARRAYVAGIDGFRFLDSKKNWVVTGRVALSRLDGDAAAIQRIQELPQHYFQRPDSKQARLDPGATSISGWTGSINLNRQNGDFQVNAALWATSPGFESNDLGFNFRSDRWGGHVVGSYQRTKPDRFTRRRWIGLAKWYALNFDGDRQGDGINLFSNAQFRNYWFAGVNAFKRLRSQNDNLTRGGPSAASLGGQGGGAWVETDNRKRATGVAEFFSESFPGGGSFRGYWLSLKVKPTSGLSIQLGPSLRKPYAAAQWVDGFDDASAAATFGRRYVFADMRQTELSMTTRINWILSPRLSVQVYAQPLISSGDYTGFKEFTTPRRFEFARYGVDRGTLDYDRAADEYRADPDGAGQAPPLTFSNPDFNIKSLRVNAVLRWEWRLGSALYVVWTQNRASDANPGNFELGRDLNSLFGAPGDDVFLVKFSYRLGR